MEFAAKKEFLQRGIFPLLQSLSTDAPAAWGKMNAQQMVEHLTIFFKVSSGQLYFPLAVPEEHLPKYKAFLQSDKQFRENTKAPAAVIGEDTQPTSTKDLPEAIDQLRVAVLDFFKTFQDVSEKQVPHPAFGPLHFEEWVLLHFKHAGHHLRQFNIIVPGY